MLSTSSTTLARTHPDRVTALDRKLRGRRVERVGFGLELSGISGSWSADRATAAAKRRCSAAFFGCPRVRKADRGACVHREVRTLVEEAVAQLLGLVEIVGVSQVDGVIGHLVEPLTLVIDDRSPAGAGSVDGHRRGVATLLFTGGDGSSFVLNSAAQDRTAGSRPARVGTCAIESQARE